MDWNGVPRTYKSQTHCVVKPTSSESSAFLTQLNSKVTFLTPTGYEPKLCAGGESAKCFTKKTKKQKKNKIQSMQKMLRKFSVKSVNHGDFKFFVL